MVFLLELLSVGAFALVSVVGFEKGIFLLALKPAIAPVLIPEPVPFPRQILEIALKSRFLDQIHIHVFQILVLS